jgi:signal transduction histidine kinase
VNQQTVVLISDDVEFPRTLIAHWKHERVVPSFSVLGTDALTGSEAPACDLALVGPVRGGRLTPALNALDTGGRSVLCVADGASIEALRPAFPRISFFSGGFENLECVVSLAAEMLRRVDCLVRARRAEQTIAKLETEAAVGRYVREVRHGMNNALTSVLGNAELLLLQPDRFSGDVREQLETIHMMSLRMHEMLYRISSLEHEMRCAQKQSQFDTDAYGDAAAAGA